MPRGTTSWLLANEVAKLIVGIFSELPDAWKTRLTDSLLTKLAEGAERSNLPGASEWFRDWRSDTPLQEDVKSVLGDALWDFEGTSQFSEDVKSVVLTEEFWTSEVVGEMAQMLLSPWRPMSESGRAAVRRASKGLMDDATCEDVLDAVSRHVRVRLFEHPKLIRANSVMLQRESFELQKRQIQQAAEALKVLEKIESAVARPPALESSRTGIGDGLGFQQLPSRSNAALGGDRLFVVPITGDRDSAPLPDVLTPRFSDGPSVVAAYTPVLGLEAATWLGSVQDEVIRSIGEGDFSHQVKISEELVSMEVGGPQIAAAGKYLLGEAERIGADFSVDAASRRIGLGRARDAYGDAIELDSGNPRAMRGLGRVHEVVGDVDAAMTLYARARARALDLYLNGASEARNDFAHELLRASRHYVSCIAQIIIDDRTSAWSREDGKEQLLGFASESYTLHLKVLAKYHVDDRWRKIEWFMGLVLIAKGVAVGGKPQKAWSLLCHALDARMSMVGGRGGDTDGVLRGNLVWWCRTAYLVGDAVPGFKAQVEQLEQDVKMGLPPWSTIESILLPITPPWKSMEGISA